MNLLKPKTYRFKRSQEAWLQRRANQDGHGNKAIVLRLLVDRAMQEVKQQMKCKGAA
jgi:hypothetical protein